MGINPPFDPVSDTNSQFISVDRGRDGIWHAILCCIWDDGCPLACNEGFIHGVQCNYLSLTIYIYSGLQIATYQSDLLEVCDIILDFTAANIICSWWMYLELEHEVWGLHTFGGVVMLRNYLKASLVSMQAVLKATRTQIERELMLEDVHHVQDLPAYNLLCPLRKWRLSAD